MQGKWLPAFLAILGISLFFFSCGFPLRDPTSSEGDKSTQLFDAPEKIVSRAIIQVLKDKGFGQAKEEKAGEDQSRIVTEYVVQGDWRTKVEATVKKIKSKETEVTLAVITEQKTSKSDWKPKNIMGKDQLMSKDQYEKFFGEIELQIYREWAK